MITTARLKIIMKWRCETYLHIASGVATPAPLPTPDYTYRLVCTQNMNSLDRKCLDAFTNSKRKESLRLLQQIEHPNRLKNTVDRTLLHFAAQHGWLDIVELLVTKYSCDVDSKDAYSKTPVFLATLNGHLDVVKYLSTSCKCDLTITDQNGETPLSKARRHKYKDLVKFLTGELDSNSKPCKLFN